MAAFGAFAGKAHESLVAHHRRTAGEGEAVEMRRCAPTVASRLATCKAARLRDLDVIDLRLVADHQLERGIDLVVAPPALVALDDAWPARPSPPRPSERTNADGRLVATASRRRDGSAACSRRAGAIYESRRRRLMKAVLSATAASSVAKARPTWAAHQRVAFAERVSHRVDGNAWLRSQVGHVGRESAVDKHQATALNAAK